jgi:FKBP-type peptidyl-prolyl cis-trans isomerase FklB
MKLFAFLLPAVAYATNAFGEAFLKENAGKDGVITLDSGLQYKVIRAGEGKEHPLVNAPCSCHYEGRSATDYPEGPKFDSSYDRGSPSTFAPNQVIKGWTEGERQCPLLLLPLTLMPPKPCS